MFTINSLGDHIVTRPVAISYSNHVVHFSGDVPTFFTPNFGALDFAYNFTSTCNFIVTLEANLITCYSSVINKDN